MFRLMPGTYIFTSDREQELLNFKKGPLKQASDVASLETCQLSLSGPEA